LQVSTALTLLEEVELLITDASHERLPLGWVEDEHRSASVLGIAYCDPPIDERDLDAATELTEGTFAPRSME
jgi:hypothetical protein